MSLRPTDPNFEKVLHQWLEEDPDDEIEVGPEFDDSDQDPDFIVPNSNQSATSDSSESDSELVTRSVVIPNKQINENEDVTIPSCSSNLPSTNYVYFGKDKFVWNSQPQQQTRKTPSHNIIRGLPGLTTSAKVLGNTAAPVDICNMLLDVNIVSEIVQWTNQKLLSMREKIQDPANLCNYRETDPIEIRALLGLLMFSSIFKSGRERMQSLFSTGPSGRPIFRCTMSVKRFEILLLALRFDDSRDRETRKLTDRAAAISKIFEQFLVNCQELFVPSENLCIDEMLIPFRGRCPFKIYMPKKPAKYGIKVVCLTDAKCSYLYDAYIYTGKDSDGIGLTNEEKKLGKPTQSVLRATKTIQKTNRNITGDNWFSSVELTNNLKDRGLSYVGTVRKNKKQIPKEFQASTSREIGSTLYGFTKDLTLISFVPKKNRAVILISSMHHSRTEDNGKPEIINYYNATKSGVDTLDMKCANYGCNRRTRRWPMAIFFTLLNVAIVNGYILYLCFSGNKIVKRFDFVYNLGMEMVKPHLSQRLTIKNLPVKLRNNIREVLQLEDELPDARDLKTDRLDKRKTCSTCPYQKTRKTAYKCIKCSKPICLECSYKICKLCS